jgi:hypothetical protein
MSPTENLQFSRSIEAVNGGFWPSCANATASELKMPLAGVLVTPGRSTAQEPDASSRNHPRSTLCCRPATGRNRPNSGPCRQHYQLLKMAAKTGFERHRILQVPLPPHSVLNADTHTVWLKK